MISLSGRPGTVQCALGWVDGGPEGGKMGKSEDMWEKTTLIFTCNNKPESQREDESKHSLRKRSKKELK